MNSDSGCQYLMLIQTKQKMDRDFAFVYGGDGVGAESHVVPCSPKKKKKKKGAKFH
jgi:hypothetical protein